MTDENPKIDEKHANFKRLAIYRTNRVLKRFEMIGNLANKSSYHYSQEEVDEIIGTIQNGFDILIGKFKPKGTLKLEFKGAEE